jgi:hypothetical protein
MAHGSAFTMVSNPSRSGQTLCQAVTELHCTYLHETFPDFLILTTIYSDSHPYVCFGPQDTSAITTRTQKPCTSWGKSLNNSMAAYGMTAAGEFSNAINDCGLFLNGVNRGARYDGTFNPYSGPNGGAGSCVEWMDVGRWSDSTKAAVKEIALSSMDALQVCLVSLSCYYRPHPSYPLELLLLDLEDR